MSLRDLLEQRAAAVARMRQLTDNPAGEGGDLSDQQVQDFDKAKADLTNLEARIGRQQVLDDAERRMAAPAIIHGNGRDGAYEERARSFSLVRAINASLGESVDAGLEREISAEVKRRSGRPFIGNIAVPDEYFQVERRVLTVQAGGAPAVDLYPTQHRPDLFIDLLRSALIVSRLGATVLDGLQGDQDIPRQTASSTAEWLAEDDAITPSDAAFDDVSLTPHTVGSITSYSRRTLINANPSIEAIVRADLAAVIARAIDNAALFGDGLNNVPLGVINTPNVNNPTLATPSWVELLAMVASIVTADADVGAMGWVMNPGTVAKLRGTMMVAGDAGAGFIMTDPGSLAGYPVVASTAVADAVGPPVTRTVIFGAWSQVLVGYWSGLELLANPYESTAYHRGRVLLRAMRYCDVAVRHAESFAFADDVPA